MTKMPEPHKKAQADLEQWLQFIQSQSHVLKEYRGLLFQQAANQPDRSLMAESAAHRLRDGVEKRPWLEWVNKPQYRDPCLMVLAGHRAGVRACAFSPDGRRLVSASADHTLKIWDTESGAEVATLKGHHDHVIACAYSGGGKAILSASWDGTLKVWDPVTYTELRSHTSEASFKALAASSDGKRIITASGEAVDLWDAELNSKLGTFPLVIEPVDFCALSPDGTRFASGWGYENALKIRDPESGSELVILSGHSAGINGCAFSPDGRRIVSASNDQTLKIWDSETGAELATLAGHSNWVTTCAYAPNGKRIVSGSTDKTVKIWDAESGTELATLAGHSGWIKAASYSLDGSRLASASDDETLRIWDAEPRGELESLPGHSRLVRACAHSPDGRRVVTASDELKIWDAETGAELARFAESSQGVHSCAYSPDGKRLISYSGKIVKVWDVETCSELTSLAHDEGVGGCSYSPDGSRIVSRLDRTLKLWDAESGAGLVTLTGHSGGLVAWSYSPDGRRIVSGSWDKTVRVWDPLCGAELLCLHTASLPTTDARPFSGIVHYCVYSPDGRRIAYIANELKVSDAESGAELLSLSGADTCGYSPDGRRIAAIAGNWLRDLRIWDARSGAELGALTGHSGAIIAWSYSPDGDHIASVSNDSTVRIWDTLATKQLACFVAATEVKALALGRLEHLIAVGDRGGRVYILRLRNYPVLAPLLNTAHLFDPVTGQWEGRPTTRCKSCGSRFAPAQDIVNAIQSISRDAGLSPQQSPCEVLPDQAWNNALLRSECPHCHQPQRFNPFIVDNRDRY